LVISVKGNPVVPLPKKAGNVFVATLEYHSSLTRASIEETQRESISGLGLRKQEGDLRAVRRKTRRHDLRLAKEGRQRNSRCLGGPLEVG
jgi:hypothetical protein